MDLSSFFSMGGYGFYVWGSYLATLVVLGGELLSLSRRRRALAKQKRDAHGIKE
jgi:heme exporter protein D